MSNLQKSQNQSMTLIEALNIVQTKLNAPKGQYNSFGRYHYRSCEDILQAVKPLLQETGACITLSDEVVVQDNACYIRATATFWASGESLSCAAYAREERDKKGMDAAQMTGSASSYARKYALNGLLCIDDNKDPDATNTHGQDAAAPAAQAPKKSKEPIVVAINPKPKTSKVVDKVQQDIDSPFEITKEDEDRMIAEIDKCTNFDQLLALYKSDEEVAKRERVKAHFSARKAALMQ